ncbi:MAG: restriction endonuclease subunit S [Alphaproteobacteria bacterium]|nr:restriction endonuclease subunit S [Alphaproteobacteria bacterium]
MQNNQKIPEGWSVKKLGECFSFLKTPSYSRAETTSDGEVHYIHYGDIHTKYPLHVCPEDIDIFVTNEQAQKGDFLQTGDLILLDASEDYDGTTKCIELTTIKDSDKVISGLHTLALRDNYNNFVNGFRAYITSMPFVKNNFWKQVTGIKVYGVSKDNLKKLKLLLPPLAEQEKIAGILGTWDEAIEKLSSLIEQKKLLKKGLMQRLLTGETRLNDFTQPWKEVKLGEICKFEIAKSKSSVIDENGKYYIIDMGAVSTEGILISNKRTNLCEDLLKVNDIVMPKDDIGGGNIIGKTAIIKQEDAYVLSDHVFKLKIHDSDAMFISYLINSFKYNKYMRRMSSGSAILGLAKKDIEKCMLYIPSDITEQKAIADVLSTADEEIDLLNKKLEALKEQKKGLMQQLLTGQTRVKVN